VVELPSEKAARQIASRSVGLRCCMELWARAKTEEELHKNIQSYPLELMKPYFKPELSFKINVETFCNRQSQAEKVAKIEVCICALINITTCMIVAVVFLYQKYYGEKWSF